ncbi:MAG TPA: hypothetical protein VLA76_00690, partial [Candidatus Angelobacter sp.]|nr:hypothetical protein [Candidatus Angelobacter sp.]
MDRPPEPQWGRIVSTSAVSAQKPDSGRVERRRGRRSTSPAQAIRLHLLGSFRLTIGGTEASINHPAQRLLVLLALRRNRLLRSVAAGLLWLDLSEERAAANLRSVLWRLRSLAPIVDTRHG